LRQKYNSKNNNLNKTIMEILFKLVSSAEAYADEYGFHAHFFESAGGFTTAFLITLAVAAVCCIIYYFGLCMSNKTIQAATLPVWIVFLLLSAGISFVATDMIVIGSEVEEDSEATSSNFYADLDSYYIDLASDAPKTEAEAMNEAKNDIIQALDQGDDVALMLGLNSAILAVVFFYILSIILKGFTTTGVAIPHLKPHSRK